jgi:hypothetical protein
VIPCITAGCWSNCQCVCWVRSIFPWIGPDVPNAYQYAGVLGPKYGCAQIVPPTTAQAGDIIIWPAFILGTNDTAGHIAAVIGNDGHGELMITQANFYGDARVTNMPVPASRVGQTTVWRPPPSRNAAVAACAASAGAPVITPLGGPTFPVCAAAPAPAPIATAADVEALYEEYLGRPADAQGLAYWTGQPLAVAVVGIGNSPEAIAHRQPAPSSTTTTTTSGLAIAAAITAVAALGLASYRRVPAVRTAVLRSQVSVRPVILRG